MKNHIRPTAIEEQARIFLIANIVFIYFLTVVAVVLSIEHFKAPLYKGDYFTVPTAMLLVVWFLYYLAPILLGVTFGLIFKPFGKSFRNIFITIIAIQFLYSFAMSMFRWDYLQNMQKKNEWRKSDVIKILDLNPKHFDRNEDGYIEEILLSPQFDFTKLRAGEYLIEASIVPGGVNSPFMIDGGGVFTIESRSAKNKISKDFAVRLRPELNIEGENFEDEDFQVKFLLLRVITVDERGNKLLRFCRWSPFLRITGWGGEDREISGDIVLLDTKTTTQKFTLRVPHAQTQIKDNDGNRP